MKTEGKRVVLMICDGHRDDFVRPELCPAICDVIAQGRRFARHQAIFPSATRASAASIATGCWPARHGLHGNTMALDDGSGLVVHDVGKPDFVDTLRRITGQTLQVSTLAERVKDHGGAIIMSNVSPGAAYFHDPDGYGYVYHRAASFGPGRIKLPPEDARPVTHDAAGDRALTERFCTEVLMQRKPTLGVLWLCEPDHSMHADVLGSDTHLRGIREADACVACVDQAVGELRAAGEDVLFVLGSDHGQESVADAIPVAALLVEAGFKASLNSSDVVIAPQGGGAHLYLARDAWHLLPDVHAWLAAQPWCGQIFTGPELAAIGHRPGGAHALSIAMRHQDVANAHGVPGLIDICTSEEKPGKPPGHGSHGGLGAYETRPFLTISGGGFAVETIEHGASRLIDIAPTILRHLNLARDGVDGLALPQS